MKKKKTLRPIEAMSHKQTVLAWWPTEDGDSMLLRLELDIQAIVEQICHSPRWRGRAEGLAMKGAVRLRVEDFQGADR